MINVHSRFLSWMDSFILKDERGTMKIRQNSTRKKAMLQALEKTMGVVSDASRLAKIDRKTHYNWLKSDKNYAEYVQDLENRMVDFAESALLKLIEQGNTTSIIFFLKCKGKKRGYSQKIVF